MCTHQLNPGLGSLWSFATRNWFASAANHKHAADKLEGLKGYIVQYEIQRSTVNDFAVSVGASFPAVAAAMLAVDALGGVVGRARALIRDAQASVSDAPSDPPPAGVDLDNWRESWFIDLDAMNRILPELDQARVASSAALNSAAAAVTAELARQGKRADIMPVGPTPTRVNWDIDSVPVPSWLKTLGRALDSFGNVNFGRAANQGISGALAIGGGALLLYLLIKSKGAGK